MKAMYEIFDEFEMAKTKKDKLEIIGKNLSQTLYDVFRLTFHPDFQWFIEEIPEQYTIQNDSLPGISRTQLSTEIRKMYLFQKGNADAEKLTPAKRKQLLCQLLEALEPREAEVVMGILRKDQGVEGLDYKFIKEAFVNLLP